MPRFANAHIHGHGSRTIDAALAGGTVHGMSRTGRALLRGALVVVLCLGSATAAAQAMPRSFEASYTLSAQGMDVARSHWSLRSNEDGTFQYTTRSESIGLAKLLRDQQVEEHSRFVLHRGQVRPLEYRYARTGRKPRTAAVRFDWQRGTGSNAINDSDWSMPLTPGMQDKLSYLFAIMLAVGRDGEPPEQITLSDGGKLKTYSFKLLGRESRDTLRGPLDTLVVERTTPGEARVTRIWLAPELAHLPVRIEHREDGETLSIRLQALQGPGG
jgi:hypothetical protein